MYVCIENIIQIFVAIQGTIIVDLCTINGRKDISSL